MSGYAMAVCALVIALGTLRASNNPKASALLASYYSLMLTATLSLILTAPLFAPSAAAFIPRPLGTFLMALAVSAGFGFVYARLLKHRSLQYRRIKGHTGFAVSSATAASLLAPSALDPSTWPITLFAAILLGAVFYVIIIMLAALREAMRIRAALSTLSTANPPAAESSQCSHEAKPIESQEIAHALMALSVLSFCLLAFVGAL